MAQCACVCARVDVRQQPRLQAQCVSVRQSEMRCSCCVLTSHPPMSSDSEGNTKDLPGSRSAESLISGGLGSLGWASRMFLYKTAVQGSTTQHCVALFAGKPVQAPRRKAHGHGTWQRARAKLFNQILPSGVAFSLAFSLLLAPTSMLLCSCQTSQWCCKLGEWGAG